MNRFFLGAATALALSIPAAAPAQQLPAATVGVVDGQRILEGCTVCQAANQQIEAQQAQLRQRAQQLGLSRTQENTPTALENEATAIQNALSALAQGQQPDATLQARAQTFQTNLGNAQREVASREQQIRRNQAFVLQQIQARVAPAIAQVAQQRGATVVLEASNIAWSNPAVDLTPNVLTLINQNTAPLNVNAPPPPQQPAQQQQQQRPQGR